MSTHWTEKGTRAKCRRKLNAIKSLVATLAGEIAYEWGDVDQTIVEACDALIAGVNAKAGEIEAFMTERVDETEASDEPPIDERKEYVPITQIAKVAGVTRKHVRRQVSRAREGRAWLGAEMRAVVVPGGDVLVEFTSLPEPIREALVMKNQAEMPFPPMGAEQIKLD